MHDDIILQHFKNDEEFQKEIRDELRSLRENHLHHIEKNINEVRTDLEWIKHFFWLITGISLTAILTSLFTLILR